MLCISFSVRYQLCSYIINTWLIYDMYLPHKMQKEFIGLRFLHTWIAAIYEQEWIIPILSRKKTIKMGRRWPQVRKRKLFAVIRIIMPSWNWDICSFRVCHWMFREFDEEQRWSRDSTAPNTYTGELIPVILYTAAQKAGLTGSTFLSKPLKYQLYKLLSVMIHYCLIVQSVVLGPQT